jgi:hypothetical protein
LKVSIKKAQSFSDEAIEDKLRECCQHRPFVLTLLEHGVPFFVIAPQKYAGSSDDTS